MSIANAPAAQAAGGPAVTWSYDNGSYTLKLPASDAWEVKQLAPLNIFCGTNYSNPCATDTFTLPLAASACITVQVDWAGRHDYNSDDYEFCAPEPEPEKMVWVCKIVGSPGDYRVKEGKNPIYVSVNSTDADEAFADSHPSYIVDGEDSACTYTPPPPPEVKEEVGVYWYKVLDNDLDPAWENSGPQTFCESKTGYDWFTSLSCELPTYVCGDGWAYQQDKVRNWTTAGAFPWPSTIVWPHDNIGWPPIYDAKHGWLSELTTVPDCDGPGVTITSGECYYNASQDLSFKPIYLTFNNTSNNVPATFTVNTPYGDLSRTVPAGESVTVRAQDGWQNGVGYEVTVGDEVFNVSVPAFDSCMPIDDANTAVTLLTSCGVAHVELRNDLGTAVARETALVDVYFDGEFHETLSAEGGEVTNADYTFPEDSGDVVVSVKNHADDVLLATATVKTDCLPPASLEGQDLTYRSACSVVPGLYTLVTTTTPWKQGWVSDGNDGWKLADKVYGTSSDATSIVNEASLKELGVTVPKNCVPILAFTGPSEFDAFVRANIWYIMAGVLATIVAGALLIIWSVRRTKPMDEPEAVL